MRKNSTILIIITVLQFGSTIFGNNNSSYKRFRAHKFEIINNPKSSNKYGLLDSMHTKIWDTTSYKWLMHSKAINKYDINKNLVNKETFTWDKYSLKWIPNTRYEYFFDEFNKDTLENRFKWDTQNSKWENNYKLSQNYDNNGNRKVYISNRWDVINNEWVGDDYSICQYDTNKNSVDLISFVWNLDNKVWKYRGRYTYMYENNQLVLTQSFYWNENNNNWQLSQQKINKYDIDSHLIETAESSTESNINKYEYIYKNNKIHKTLCYTGCILDSIYQKIKLADTVDHIKDSVFVANYCYDAMDGGISICKHCSKDEWYLTQMDSIEYDSIENSTKEFHLEWDLVNKLWINNYRYDIKYNVWGTKESSVSYVWEPINKTWIHNNKFIYQFDSNGNEIAVCDSMWDKANKVWISDITNLQIYNSNNQLSIFETYRYSWIFKDFYEIARSEFEYTDNTDLNIRTDYSKGDINGDWIKNSQSVYYWSYGSTLVNNARNDKFSVNVYPVPFKDYIKVSVENSEIIRTIDIYNSTGTKLLTVIPNYFETDIPTSQLKSGSYILQIKTNKSTISKPLIKI